MFSWMVLVIFILFVIVIKRRRILVKWVELEIFSIFNSFENIWGIVVIIFVEFKYIFLESLLIIEWELLMDCKVKVKRDSSFLYLKEKNYLIIR